MAAENDTSTVYESLMAAVCAAPDDDAPRLVLADWYSQQGDPRGEFIIISCDLAKDPNRVDLRKRCNELLSLYHWEWCDALGVEEFYASFHRGLLETVTLATIQRATRAVPLLFGKAPIRSLDFCGASDQHVIEVFSRPLQPSLRELRIELMSEHAAYVMARSSFVGSLRELRIPSCPSTHELTFLAGSKQLSKLTVLEMHSEFMSQDSVWALAKSKHITSLTSLSLANNELGDEAARAIATGASLSKLEYLDLTRNDLTDEGALALAKSPNLQHVKGLTVRGNAIEAEGHAALRARFGNALVL